MVPVFSGFGACTDHPNVVRGYRRAAGVFPTHAMGQSFCRLQALTRQILPFGLRVTLCDTLLRQRDE